ncbi:MAG: hypothetical protein AAYR33_09655 [Acetobacteraceae bacterium]
MTPADLRVFIASCVAGLAGLLFGYDQGIISAALLTIEHGFPLSLFGKRPSRQAWWRVLFWAV